MGLRLLADFALGDMPQQLVNSYETQTPGHIESFSKLARPAILDAVRARQVDAALLLYDTDTADTFSVPIGYETLLVVVHPDVGIEKLSGDQLRAILSGQSTHWNEFGGAAIPIHVIVPQAASSGRAFLEATLMRGQGITMAARLAAESHSLYSNILGTQGDIGIGAANSFESGIKSLMIGSCNPQIHGSNFDSCPLIAQVVLVTSHEPQGQLKAFLDWAFSPSGQQVVQRFILGLNQLASFLHHYPLK